MTDDVEAERKDGRGKNTKLGEERKGRNWKRQRKEQAAHLNGGREGTTRKKDQEGNRKYIKERKRKVEKLIDAEKLEVQQQREQTVKEKGGSGTHHQQTDSVTWVFQSSPKEMEKRKRSSLVKEDPEGREGRGERMGKQKDTRRKEEGKVKEEKP